MAPAAERMFYKTVEDYIAAAHDALDRGDTGGVASYLRISANIYTDILHRAPTNVHQATALDQRGLLQLRAKQYRDEAARLISRQPAPVSTRVRNGYSGLYHLS